MWLTDPHDRPSHGPVANGRSRTFHARPPLFTNIWHGRVTTNSVNASDEALNIGYDGTHAPPVQ